jgi:threonine aldolase
MSQPAVDLRSDTVTRPTAAMRQAMAEAEVGDDVFGDDPTVIALERRIAALAGKEAALFVPSGTMGNQLAVNVLTRPADEVLLEAESHIYYYEQGGMAASSGCLAHPVRGERGVLPLEPLLAALRDPGDDHVARVSLVCAENTHNRHGGAVVPLLKLRELAAMARERKLRVHLDGARLWNAHVATGVAIADYAACADTVMMCFSKGLGAPVGSILTGSAEHVRAARRVRKRWGGGMRQVGILAAACLHALDHHVARLADDHRRAKRLAEGFSGAPEAGVVAPDTNIVFVDLRSPAPDAKTAVAMLEERGVRMSAYGPRRVRAIAHLDVDDAGVERAISAFRDVLATPAAAGRR